MARAQGIIAAAFIIALAGAAAASAHTSGTTTPPGVKMGPLEGPLSQAQLIQGLQAHGYTNIKLSSDTGTCSIRIPNWPSP